MEENHLTQEKNFFVRNRGRLLGVVALAILIIGGVYFSKNILRSAEHSYFVKAGVSYASDVYIYTPGSAELTQFFFTKDGQQVAPVDVIPMSDGSFYYIQFERFESAIVANIFLRTKDGTDVKITHSDTMKYGLQVAKDGAVVFQEKQATKAEEIFDQRPWNIALVRAGNKAQEAIGQGTDPSFLKGSSVIVFRSASGLERYNVENRETLQMVSDIGAYAIDSESGALFAENSVTHQLDIFDILDDTSLTYRESVSLPNKISTLIAKNGNVTIGYTSISSGMERLVIEDLVSTKKHEFSLPPSRLLSVPPQIISLYLYEE